MESELKRLFENVSAIDKINQKRAEEKKDWDRIAKKMREDISDFEKDMEELQEMHDESFEL